MCLVVWLWTVSGRRSSMRALQAYKEFAAMILVRQRQTRLICGSTRRRQSRALVALSKSVIAMVDKHHTALKPAHHMQGMAASREFTDRAGKRFSLALISRRSCLHPGMRYIARGLNALASPGNESEVEQLVWTHPSGEQRGLATGRPCLTAAELQHAVEAACLPQAKRFHSRTCSKHVCRDITPCLV